MVQYFPVVTGSLTVTGSINVSGGITASGGISISGSIASASFASTASFVALAQSASNAVAAATASFANAFTVAGNLTAQTLVVQTITSSVDFVTGSTRFGSIIGNTHQFTGSMFVTGALYIATGSVGVGTISPSSILHIVDTSTNDTTLTIGQAGEVPTIKAGGANTDLRIEAVGSGGYLDLVTNATSSIRITGTGKVGIGTTNPTQLLVVSDNNTNGTSVNIINTSAGGYNWNIFSVGSAASIAPVGSLAFRDSNNGVTRMAITSGGNVGIGRTDPSFILDVNDTNASGARGLRISTSSTAAGPALYLYINNGVQTNWAIGNSYAVSNTLEFISSNSVGGNPGAAGTSRMLITPTGNVTINTARSSGANVDIMTLSDNVTGVQTSGFGVRILATSNNGQAKSAIAFEADGGTNNDTAIAFYTQTSAASLDRRMTINKFGNIIIGSDKVFGINTTDGSDNGYLALTGAGADGEARGGHIYLSGNERSSDPGTVVLSAGNVSGGSVIIRTGAGTERMRVTNGGIIYALNTGVDGTYQPMIGGMYSSNNNETNLISTAVSSNATQSGFRFDVSNGAGSSARTTSMTINRSSVTIVGSLSKGSGSFRIKHPLASKKDTHQLVHSFIEGPQADLIYSGGVTLVDGKATINIDEAATMTEGTFEALCRNIRVFTSNETSWDNVRGKVVGNILTIECQNTESTDEISWLVIGERQDEHMMDTEWTDENGKVIVEPLIPSIIM